MHVVLIHGQGRSPLSMSLLGWRLSRQQHQVHYFGYAAFCQTFDDITRRFVQMIRDEIGDRPYAIVSHSLGGIITRASLPHLADIPPQHLVMLAPPNQPARIAKKMRPNQLYWWVTWDCGRKLADDAFYESLPRPTVPTTIIAGTKGLHGRLQQSLFEGEEVNDTILSVQETELSEAQEVILVPASHGFIMNSKQVAEIVSEVIGNERRVASPV
jgi:pimeloyl-ACP methyl ester carboxylesterase